MIINFQKQRKMPKKGEKEGEICNFIQKLWDILENPDFAKILLWSSGGKSFAIVDPTLLETSILPTYFRHSKLKSFVRQLNMYDFKKSQRDKELLIFFNHNFKRHQKEKLPLIRRKISKKLKIRHPLEEASFSIAQSENHNDSPFKEAQIPITDASKMVAPTETSKFQSESSMHGPQIKSFGRLIEDNSNLIPFISPYSYASIRSQRGMIAEEENDSESLIDLDIFKNGSTSVEQGWGNGFTSCQYFL